ncbi:MAG: TetR/AcrR family transcriptional regulator C-terminal domain-containing protein [Bacteroidales bacterium]|nr:TetR/AcrR family transcriptional regulator C-terminal domain-containing protein [Bacteroidales bacterium]
MKSSAFLKDCLADATMQLLKDYRLEEIQIKQICNLAGYHRASWFRAFRSKHEAVTYKMVRLWEQWCERHNVEVRNEFTLDNADTFFQYNYEIRDTLRLLHRRGLMDDVAASFHSIMYEHHREDPHQAYPAAMYAYALFGMLYAWVVRDFDTTPDEMADIIRKTLV